MSNSDLMNTIEQELKILIKSESLQPGDRLPNLDQLVTILNVSRSKLRDALLSLQSEGILDIKQGKGIRLGIHTVEKDNEATIESLRLQHLQETRLAIESETAYLAAVEAKEHDKQELLEAIQILQEEHHAQDVESIVAADYNFHYIIARIVGNPVLLEILRYVNKELEPGRTMTLSFPKGIDKTIRGHYKVYEAIRDNHPELARLHMRTHLNEVSEPQTSLTLLKRNLEADRIDYRIDKLLASLTK